MRLALGTAICLIPLLASAATTTTFQVNVRDALSEELVPQAQLFLTSDDAVRHAVPSRGDGSFRGAVAIPVGAPVAITATADGYAQEVRQGTWGQDNKLPDLRLQPLLRIDPPRVSALGHGMRAQWSVRNVSATSVQPGRSDIRVRVAPAAGCNVPGTRLRFAFRDLILPVGVETELDGTVTTPTFAAPLAATARADLDNCSGGTVTVGIAWHEALDVGESWHITLDIPGTIEAQGEGGRVARLAPETDSGCLQSDVIATVDVGRGTLASAAGSGFCLRARAP